MRKQDSYWGHQEKFKMVVGVGVFSGLEKLSVVFGDVGLGPQDKLYETA